MLCLPQLHRSPFFVLAGASVVSTVTGVTGLKPSAPTVYQTQVWEPQNSTRGILAPATAFTTVAVAVSRCLKTIGGKFCHWKMLAPPPLTRCCSGKGCLGLSPKPSKLIHSRKELVSFGARGNQHHSWSGDCSPALARFLLGFGGGGRHVVALGPSRPHWVVSEPKLNPFWQVSETIW